MTNNEFGKLLDKKLVGVATAKDIKRLDEGLTKVKQTMATQNDLKNLVTKEDAKNFATRTDLNFIKEDLSSVKGDISTLKEDAKNFATKKDLDFVKRDIGVLKEDAKNFATKKDLERFATKKDLEAVRGDVQEVGFQLKITERRFEQKLEDTFSKYTKEMLDKFDQVIGELQMIREENVFRQVQFERLVERVERLEQHAGLQPLPVVL